MIKHGLTRTTPLIDEAIQRNVTRLKNRYGSKLGFTDEELTEGLTNMALYSDSEKEAIQVVDEAVPLGVWTALEFF